MQDTETIQVPPPQTKGPPPRPRGTYEEVKKNPVTSVPTQKTRQFRIRGRYGKKETAFVIEELKRLGYSLTTSNNNWDIIWTVRMFKEEFAILAPFQKVNFMPALHHICSKNLLHHNICSSRTRWMENIPQIGDQTLTDFALCSFWPVGFNLEIEDQFEALTQIFASNSDVLYIIKKPFSSCGRGVSIIHSLDQLLSIKQQEEYLPLTKVKPLAQEYIKNVKLFDGFKFTIRLYVSLTGVDPLSVHVYDNGLLRICSKRYSLDKDTMNDDFVHIDSIAINIHNESPEELSDRLYHEGLRCDIKSYLKILEEEYPEEQVKDLWQNIKDLVAMSILAAEEPITKGVTSICKQRSHTFEIFGYDILIDEQLKPWLLEINHTPSLEPLTDLENIVKKNMLHDLFQLCDITSQRRIHIISDTDRLWGIIQKIQEEVQQGLQPECILYNSALSDIDFSLFDRTMVWILLALESEDANCGGFQRVLPDRKFLPFSLNKRRTSFISHWRGANLSITKDIYLSSTSDEDIDE